MKKMISLWEFIRSPLARLFLTLDNSVAKLSFPESYSQEFLNIIYHACTPPNKRLLTDDTLFK